jgi:hypothetical protein
VAEFDVDAMIDRFRLRSKSVRDRGIPPLEGTARRQFIEQAEQDFTDYQLVASASWSVEDDCLVLRIPLKPPE